MNYISNRRNIMPQTPTQVILSLFPDKNRLYLIADNPDWDDVIIPSLVELGNLLDSGRLEIEPYFRIMRCVVETVYVMGYLRGKNKSPITFVEFTEKE
jgi:hypothetical protein